MLCASVNIKDVLRGSLSDNILTKRKSRKLFPQLTSFLKQHLGAGGPETADVEALKLEVTELRTEVEKLTEQNKELQAKVHHIVSNFR